MLAIDWTTSRRLNRTRGVPLAGGLRGRCLGGEREPQDTGEKHAAGIGRTGLELRRDLLYDAERLGGLDTQAAAGWANGGELPGQHHRQCRDWLQRAAEGAEHLALAGAIGHDRQHDADHDPCRELQRRPRENAS